MGCLWHLAKKQTLQQDHVPGICPHQDYVPALLNTHSTIVKQLMSQSGGVTPLFSVSLLSICPTDDCMSLQQPYVFAFSFPLEMSACIQSRQTQLLSARIFKCAEEEDGFLLDTSGMFSSGTIHYKIFVPLKSILTFVKRSNKHHKLFISHLF